MTSNQSKISYNICTVYNMMQIRCSLCNMLFDDSDELIQERKRRHEQWHRLDMTSYKRNAIIGDVVWIPNDAPRDTGIQNKIKK